MTEQQLRDAIIRLCQDYGFTTEDTYDKVTELIETIVTVEDE